MKVQSVLSCNAYSSVVSAGLLMLCSYGTLAASSAAPPAEITGSVTIAQNRLMLRDAAHLPIGEIASPQSNDAPWLLCRLTRVGLPLFPIGQRDNPKTGKPEIFSLSTKGGFFYEGDLETIENLNNSSTVPAKEKYRVQIPSGLRVSDRNRYSPFVGGGISVLQYHASQPAVDRYSQVYSLPEEWISYVGPAVAAYRRSSFQKMLKSNIVEPRIASDLAKLASDRNPLIAAYALRRLASVNQLPQNWPDLISSGDHKRDALLVDTILEFTDSETIRESHLERMTGVVQAKGTAQSVGVLLGVHAALADSSEAQKLVAASVNGENSLAINRQPRKSAGPQTGSDVLAQLVNHYIPNPR